jgi:hypothetical protein
LTSTNRHRHLAAATPPAGIITPTTPVAMIALADVSGASVVSL